MDERHLPQRKSSRLQGYDYRQNGAYFVTVCTHQRVTRFGQIIDGEMRLSPLGTIAQTCWEQIPAHYPHVELDLFVIMPTHMHGIILITDSPNVGTAYMPSANSNSPAAGSLSVVIGSYKAAVSRLAHLGETLWQERFHDHIIRNEKELKIIREYVLYNPQKWQEDTFYLG